ncbi:MAG: hypothetical protein ACYC7A_21965 [Thermoanaerobaculia bacterium]
MKTTSWPCFAVFSLLMFCGVGSAEVSVTLGVEPTATLPHLPITFHIVIENVGGVSVDVPEFGVLQVRRPDGSGFIAVAESSRSQSTVATFRSEANKIALDPGERRELTVFGSLASEWMCDDRLMTPGTYEIQLILSNEFREKKPQRDLTDVVAQLNLNAAVISNKAVLRIESPSGADAEVYELIHDEPCFWDTLGVRIWTDFPSSSYRAYAPAIVPDASNQGKIEALRRALSAKPNQSWSDRLEFRIATYELDEQHLVASGRVTVEEAVAAARRAENLLRRLAKEAVDPALRDAAVSKLSEMPRREDLERLGKFARGEVVDILPTVQCVSGAGDTQRVWFGYLSYNLQTLEIPVGARNQFTPGAADQGQPSSFKGGTWDREFSVKPKAPVLTWHLDRTNLLVKLDELKSCEDVDREAYDKE